MQTIAEIEEKNSAPLNIFITTSLKERLEQATRYQNKSLAQFTREAISERLRVVEREQLILRMRAAYKANRHILEEEGKAWDTASVENIP